MKNTIRVGILLLALSAAAQEPQQPGVRVPDAATALKIATLKLERISGKKQIESEQPLAAVLNGGVWTVHGTLWCSDGHGGRTSAPGACLGGVAEIKLRQRDGKVLSVFHGK